MPLANDSYQHLAALTDRTDLLNLAWTLDEGEFLDVDLQSMVAAELRDEYDTRLPFVNDYLVRDPYGEELLGPVVRRLFGVHDQAVDVTTGAGVIALLHALSRLSGGGPCYVIGDVYPDLPHWIETGGSTCVSRYPEGSDDHAANVMAMGARLVLLERPALTGSTLDVTALRGLCTTLAGSDVVVIVDESYGNYYPPSFSATPLASELPNLIVLRGLAKAYGMGGLRLAYCVSSRALLPRVRASVPPMLASSLSLRIGRAILDAGDIGHSLRVRVQEARAEALAAFDGVSLDAPTPACPLVPFLFYPTADGPAGGELRRRGILGKQHTYWSERWRRTAYRFRLSVPLRPQRMALFRERLMTV